MEIHRVLMEEIRPGIDHRIDMDTLVFSMDFAKNDITIIVGL